MVVLPWWAPLALCRGHGPACLTTERAAEPGQVAGLGHDGRGADRGQPIDRADEFGQVEFVQDGGHAGLDLAQPPAGVPQVGKDQPEPLLSPTVAGTSPDSGARPV